MQEVILVTWNPKKDLDGIFPEKLARQLSGMLPIRGILKDYGETGGLMSCIMPDGQKKEIPVLLEEIKEVSIHA